MEAHQQDNSHTVQRQFEFNLEALRGIAALVVVFFHAFDIKFSIDPAYTPQRLNSIPGHASVLIFFILSGYVIGITNTKPLAVDTIIPYLRKRLVRLYPIYAISLLFALLIAVKTYSSITIFGHFIFLQNSVVDLIWENIPLWSLNNEVLYYLAFIPVSLYSINPGKVSIVAALFGILCATALNMPLLSSYSFGFVFWTSGLWLAQAKQFSVKFTSPWMLFALMCLFMGNEALNPFVTVALLLETKLHIHFAHFIGPSIAFSDLSHFPFCFYIFICFTNKTFRWASVVPFSTFVLGFSYFLYMIFRYGLYSPQVNFLIMPIVFFILSIFFMYMAYKKPVPLGVMPLPKILIKLGAISYGIYIIHFPISIAISHVTVFSGNAFTYAIRFVVDLILVLTAGYILELKVQPLFKKYFNKPISRI